MNFRPSRRVRSIGALTSVAVAMTVLAIVYDGTKTTDVDLNDGGVWVTYLHMDGRSVVARLNYPSRTLDSYVEQSSPTFDVSQAGTHVAVHEGDSQVQSIDTATWVAGEDATLPRGGAASQGADVMAFTDPVKGKVWAAPADDVAQFTEDATPLLRKIPGIRSVVGTNGVIHTVAPDGTLRDLVRKGDDFEVREVGSTPRIGDVEDGDVELTAVGGTGVVLNRKAGWLAWPDHRKDLDDAGSLVLQQPGSDTGMIALAASDALVEVPLDGGDVVRKDALEGGLPLAPVAVGSCIYAAWTETGDYWRDCDGEDRDVHEAHPDELARRGAEPGQVVFRTNRDLVVINDTFDGDIVLPNEDMVVVDDWAAIEAQMDAANKKKNQDVKFTKFSRTNKNRPPSPNGDTFGVRAGKTVALPVLANDTDPDGDVLLASVATARTRLGEIEEVRDGRALRIEVPDDARGSLATEYTAADGRGGTKNAPLALAVHPESQNAGPVQVRGRVSKMTMVQRGTAQHHILGEWYDPDGDPFWIDRVEFPDGMDGTFRPDGLIKVRQTKGDPGQQVVHVFLTDGRGGITDAPLTVDVKKPGTPLPPTANADYAQVVVGASTRIAPLTNDTDPNGNDLRLVTVGGSEGGRSTVDGRDGTFTFTGTRVGTHYLDYQISDGDETGKGLVRVDVAAPPSSDQLPVADGDIAVIPASGSTIVDVLANDVDPLGGVLVIQSVGAADGVSASVLDHSAIKLENTGLGPNPVTVRYSVANANGASDGSITVLAAAGGEDGGPVAYDDTAVVRAGDVVSVDVLGNDVSPGGHELRLSPDEPQVVSGAELGDAFTSEGKVRFRASGKPGLVRINYNVLDPEQNLDTGQVEIQVNPASGSNTAPSPRPTTARLVAGGKAELPLGLDGIDPDGDSVSVVGLKEPPVKGVVTFRGGVVTYQAARGAAGVGTDRFTYLVEDKFGAQAEGQVEVGIAPQAATNEKPITAADSIRVRPGRLLSVPVLANDVDPEGEPLALVADSVDPAPGQDAHDARVRKGRILLKVPDETGALRFTYLAADPAGTAAPGSLTVDVRKDAPLLPPIARDDVVPVNEVVGGKKTVDVDVLDNDEDPDGAAQVLTPSSEVPGVEERNGKLRVPVKPERQVIVYQVADVDGQVGKAVIVVPGSKSEEALRPLIKAGVDLPISVKAGELEKITASDYVVVPEGRELGIPFTEEVKPGPGWDGSKDLKPFEAPDTLQYRSTKDFYGPSSITFLAADTRDRKDPDARTAIITLPIEVISDGHTPPSLVLPLIQVSPGEDAVGTDLRRYAIDPDPGDLEKLKFSVEEPAGLDVSLDGSTLEVGAPSGAKIGLSRTFPVTVTDGENSVTVDARAEVVSSVRPEMTVRPGLISNANAGEPVTVRLPDYVTNPFANEGKKLRVVGQPGLAGGKGAVSVDGEVITVVPDKDFHGTLRLSYVVADATGDRRRQKQGQVQIQVRAVPDAPSAVLAEATESHTVQVDWRPGAANGAEITGFTVEWRGGGTDSTTVGKVASATITGLTNNREYEFRVIATNAVGDSKPSAWSRKARPDEVPPAPPSINADFDDETLHVSWGASVPDGSPVKYYIVSNGVTTFRTSGPQTKLDIPGDNGTQYEVKVRAVNNNTDVVTDGVPGAGAWSSTVIEHPNGVPAAPTNVTAQGDPPDPDPSALLSWDAAEPNGDPVTAYEVRRNGVLVPCAVDLRAARPSCRISVQAGTDARFTVRARNRSNSYTDGWGALSAQSNSVRGANGPGQVPNVTAAATGQSGRARINFGNATGVGLEDVKYQYRIGSGGWAPISKNEVVGGFTDGAQRTVQVRAIGVANGQDSEPGPPGSASVSSFAPCTVSVSVVSENYDNVTFRYTVTSHGRECRYSDGASGRTGSTASGTFDVGGGPNRQVTGRVAVSTTTSGNDASVDGSSDSATGNTWTPTITWTNGPGGCSLFTPCNWASLSVNHFRPNSSIYCWMGGVNAPDWEATYNVNGNGAVSVERTWQYQRGSSYAPSGGQYNGNYCRQN